MTFHSSIILKTIGGQLLSPKIRPDVKTGTFDLRAVMFLRRARKKPYSWRYPTRHSYSYNKQFCALYNKKLSGLKKSQLFGRNQFLTNPTASQLLGPTILWFPNKAVSFIIWFCSVKRGRNGNKRRPPPWRSNAWFH